MALTNEIMTEVKAEIEKREEPSRNEILRQFVHSKERYVADFAKKVGSNANYLRQVISGHKPVSDSLISQIAKVYPNVTHYLSLENENKSIFELSMSLPVTSPANDRVFISTLRGLQNQQQELMNQLINIQHDLSKMMVQLQQMNKETKELL